MEQEAKQTGLPANSPIVRALLLVAKMMNPDSPIEYKPPKAETPMTAYEHIAYQIRLVMFCRACDGFVESATEGLSLPQGEGAQIVQIGILVAATAAICQEHIERHRAEEFQDMPGTIKISDAVEALLEKAKRKNSLH